jgi:hypothetical protein
VRQKFATPTSHYRTYAAEPRAVYDAACATLKNMGFRITYSGAAQGKINAINDIQPDESMRGSRQVAVKVRLSPAVAGGTELKVTMTEIIEREEDRGTGFATESALQGTPLYPVFLRQVGQALGLPDKD